MGTHFNSVLNRNDIFNAISCIKKLTFIVFIDNARVFVSQKTYIKKGTTFLSHRRFFWWFKEIESEKEYDKYKYGSLHYYFGKVLYTTSKS